MQSIPVFLEVTKVADFRRKNTGVSRIKEVCHVIYIFFESFSDKVYCAKFHYCRICAADFG